MYVAVKGPGLYLLLEGCKGICSPWKKVGNTQKFKICFSFHSHLITLSKKFTSIILVIPMINFGERIYSIFTGNKQLPWCTCASYARGPEGESSGSGQQRLFSSHPPSSPFLSQEIIWPESCTVVWLSMYWSNYLNTDPNPVLSCF